MQFTLAKKYIPLLCFIISNFAMQPVEYDNPLERTTLLKFLPKELRAELMQFMYYANISALIKLHFTAQKYYGDPIKVGWPSLIVSCANPIHSIAFHHKDVLKNWSPLDGTVEIGNGDPESEWSPIVLGDENGIALLVASSLREPKFIHINPHKPLYSTISKEDAACTTFKLFPFQRYHDIKIASHPQKSILATVNHGHEPCDPILIFSNVARNQHIVLLRHADARGVRSLAFNQKGTILASGSYEGPIKLWNNYMHLDTLYGHKAAVDSLAFNTQGNLLASASSDYTVKLWNLAASQCFHTLNNAGSVRSLAFHPTKPILATATKDEINLWHLISPEMEAIIQGNSLDRLQELIHASQVVLPPPELKKISSLSTKELQQLPYYITIFMVNETDKIPLTQRFLRSIRNQVLPKNHLLPGQI